MASFITHNLGYPRIGEKREIKKIVESYWKGETTIDQVQQVGKEIRNKNWAFQKNIGISLIPSNDFSFYDQVLDMTCLLGNIPSRFSWDKNQTNLDLSFTIARGFSKKGEEKKATFASEMSKWFDTNYHYILPEFNQKRKFKIASDKVFDEFKEAKNQSISSKVVLIGPLTYLFLGKNENNDTSFDSFELLDQLTQTYLEIIKKLENLDCEWIQFDEPIFSLNLNEKIKNLFLKTYGKFNQAVNQTNLLIANYFGPLKNNKEAFFSLPVNAFHVDLVRGLGELETISRHFPKDKKLSIGVVDGRNIWKNNFVSSLNIINKIASIIPKEQLMIAPSCSLLHSPVTLRHENKINKEIKNWLSFSEEKLKEVICLSSLAKEENSFKEDLEENKKNNLSRKKSYLIHNKEVQKRLHSDEANQTGRISNFIKRQKSQKEKYNLPLFPTTTIGSFPQTKEIRKIRRQFKKNEVSKEAYESFMQQEIKNVIKEQENIGLDVLVHGEAERNDMVEYFGEQLKGYTFTENGWVQSYGSRCVKPPVLYGDVSRTKSMTVKWSTFAQSLTKSPIKGMLTGPITMLQWSFVRDDQAREKTAKQIALALKDEVLDLEKEGITIIQIDEPALREGLPLRKEDWESYLKWSVKAFKLSYTNVKDTTQIHTHMCYAEFNDIIQAIADLDADVISIETSRSQMELLKVFANFKYPNEIGPGVYDVHSSRVPSLKEMTTLLKKATDVLPAENIWVNPDCGLKTRQWLEVKEALNNMVSAAKELRNN